MSSPVNMASLAPATITVVNDPSAQVLLRSGLTDYRAAVNLIRSINLTVPPYTPLASAVANDLMFIQRGSGNFSIMFNQVGLLKGTRMWFYSTAPVGWRTVPGTGDKILACSDDTLGNIVNYNGITTAGFQGGSWQQTNWALTIDQIPAHKHGVFIYQASSSAANDIAGSGKNFDNGPTGTEPSNFTGGAGSTTASSTSPAGATNGHNHGNTWRPLANVGSICEKMG